MKGIQGREGDYAQVTGGSEDFMDEYLDGSMFQSLHGIAVTPRSYRKMELFQPGQASEGSNEQLEVCNTQSHELNLCPQNSQNLSDLRAMLDESRTITVTLSTK